MGVYSRFLLALALSAVWFVLSFALAWALVLAGLRLPFEVWLAALLPAGIGVLWWRLYRRKDNGPYKSWAPERHRVDSQRRNESP